MIIKLTQEWADAGIHLMRMLECIFEICLEKRINDIREVKINDLLKETKFVNDNGVPYSDKENKKIVKSLIHTFVGMDWMAEKIYGTYDIVSILKKVRHTIERLESNKPYLPK